MNSFWLLKGGVAEKFENHCFKPLVLTADDLPKTNVATVSSVEELKKRPR